MVNIKHKNSNNITFEINDSRNIIKLECERYNHKLIVNNNYDNALEISFLHEIKIGGDGFPQTPFVHLIGGELNGEDKKLNDICLREEDTLEYCYRKLEKFFLMLNNGTYNLKKIIIKNNNKYFGYSYLWIDEYDNYNEIIYPNTTEGAIIVGTTSIRNNQKIKEYEDKINLNKKSLPIYITLKDSDKYFVLDGHHKTQAYINLRENIPALLIELVERK